MTSEAVRRLPNPGSNRRTLALFRKALWEEHNGRCGICGFPVTFAEMWIDHVRPRSFGGGDEWENLQPSHRPCNIAKGGSNRGDVLRPNAPREATEERPIVDDAALEAWIGVPEPSPMMVRNLDPDLVREVRAEAIRRQITTGELLNEIIRAWITADRSQRT